MSFYKVKEREEVIIERWDKFVTVKTKPGLKFNMPGAFRKVAAIVPTHVTERRVNLETMTRDGIFVSVPIILHLQVSDAKQFHYNAHKPYEQAADKIISAMKQLTNNMDLDGLYQARETLGNDVRGKVGQDIQNQCGLKIVDVIVDQPKAPKSVQEAYNNAKSSEQIAKATVIAAQAEKQSVILRAEGRREELRLVGEGIAKQRAATIDNMAEQVKALVNKGISEEAALKTIVEVMRQETLRDIARNGNIIVTNTGDKDTLVADVQAAVKSLNKAQPPKPPGPSQ